jgi:NADH:ubiquinone reductase (H+-translocating)
VPPVGCYAFRVDGPRRAAAGGTLILGGGFAGAWVARLLDRPATVVSRENFMLFTPLLPEAASGSLEPRHVVVPLRQMCPYAALVLGEIESHERDAKIVRIRTDVGPLELTYERLVLALGAISRALPVPGLAEHAMGFNDLADAIALRNHVLRRLEAAVVAPDRASSEQELTFVFVGAGYAGVEALGELHDLVDDALRYYPSLERVPRRWVLVDAAPKILPEVPSRLGDYAAAELDRRGIEIHVSTTLASCDADKAVLSNDLEIPTRTLVWTAGVRPNPILAQLDVPLDERGRVSVGPTLQVEGSDCIWALGDCAAVPNRITGAIDPPMSQYALRQARRLARNLLGHPEAYGYRPLGQVGTLGRYKGIADVLGIRLRGFPAWWVTRSYHLLQLPLFSRKLRVVFDWTVALLFRRDVAELSLLGHRRRLEPPNDGV